MDETTSIAYAETLEVIKFLPPDMILRIPESVMNMMENFKSKTHMFKIDPSKKLEEQGMIYQTRVVLSVLLKNYWVNPQQREMLIKKEKYDIQRDEEEKKAKYNQDIFKQNKERAAMSEDASANITVTDINAENATIQEVQNFQNEVQLQEQAPESETRDVFSQLQTDINKNTLPITAGTGSIIEKVKNFFKNLFHKGG